MRSFVHTRTLDAPRERVFRAIAEPSLLAQWWGPAGFTSTFHHFDFTPGGAWRFTMHGPDGRDYPNENRFVEVRANERVAIEHAGAPHHFLLAIDLSNAGADTTLLRWEQAFDSDEEAARVAAFVGPANEQNLDRLEAVLRAMR